MKIIKFTPEAKKEAMEILDFEKEHGLELTVRETSPEVIKFPRYYCSFDGSKIITGEPSQRIDGKADTIDEAIKDYCKNISGRILYINNVSKGKAIRVPELQHTRPTAEESEGKQATKRHTDAAEQCVKDMKTMVITKEDLIAAIEGEQKELETEIRNEPTQPLPTDPEKLRGVLRQYAEQEERLRDVLRQQEEQKEKLRPEHFDIDRIKQRLEATRRPTEEYLSKAPPSLREVLKLAKALNAFKKSYFKI